MQKEPEISRKQPFSVCYAVGGENVVVPTSAAKPIVWDNRQLRLQVMPNPAQMVQGLLLGSSYRRLDSSVDKEVPLQVLDAGAQVMMGESFADVKRFGLAVADGSGGHYGDHQQDRQIADVAKLCSQLALSELNRYDDPDKCYAALPAIVKTLAAAAKTQGLTESCSFSAMLAFVGKDDMTVVGLGIGDCLLASLELNTGRIETICPAHESTHGAAMFPQGYHEVELRYFQQRLPKDSVLLGFTDGLWAGLPHVKLAKTYSNGLTFHEIKLDSEALASLLLPQHTHGLGAVAYDILVQHALHTLETKRAQAKQQWDSAIHAKAALPSVHSGDDSLGQIVQLQALETYRLETLIELLPENVKRLAEGALQSPYSTWHEPLSLLIQKEMPGSFVWTYGLCLLSQGLMQKANRDYYFDTYVAGLKYAAAALKRATCLVGQLLAKAHLQKLLPTYANNELSNYLSSASSAVDIGLGVYQLQQHRQYLRQRLHQKAAINELIKYNYDFLSSFVVNQWQDLLENISDASLKELITLLALGSVGRREPAPYSDLEFAWLIDKTLPVVKQRVLKKLTEWWYLHVIALGETKTTSLHSDRELFVKAGFTFDMDVGGLSPLMNDRLINTPEGLAALQEENSGSELILRNALISCCYLWGSKRLYDEYQNLLAQRLNQPSDKSVTKGLLSKKLKRSQAHALSLLEAALSEFAPSSLNTHKERKQALGFKVKEELYRLGSQVLTGLCWYYQHYQPGGFQQLQWLQEHKKLHSESRRHIQQLLEQALHWRYLAQLFYGCECEELFPDNVLNTSMGQELHYQLTQVELKQIQELYRILLPLEQATQRFLQDKCEGKKSKAFTTKGLYSSDEIFLAIAQARMGNYHEAEKYYQLVTVNSQDPSLYLLRLQNLGQRYEQLQDILREQKYLASLKDRDHPERGADIPVKSSALLETQAQELKDKAQDILQQLLLKIVLSQKQLTQQLETIYRQLPFVFRESFRIALLKINDQHPHYHAALQAALKVLHSHPDIASEGLRWAEQKQQWRTVLQQCSDEQRPAYFEGKPILLHSSLLAQRPLAASMGEQLLHNGEFKNIHIGGSSHRVIKLKLSEKHALYAKAYPEMPGMTYLIEQLHIRLLGHGVGLSELIKIEVPKKGSLPILLSHEVKGPTLDAVLRGDPQALKEIQATTTAEAVDRLDKRLVMGLMLLAMLTNPEDGIPTNFIYHLTPDNKATLVSIDHDHALFPSYLGEELQVKTILFCLPLLKEALPQSLKQDILALDAGNELRAVLRDAQAQNKAYSALFDEETMKVWHKQRKGGNTTIPIPIKKGDATKLYFKLIKLQALIKDKPELTGLACLQALEPRVGAVYAKALQEDKTPQQRLQEIGRYTTDKQGALISNTQALKSLQLTSTLLSQPEYAKLQDLSPEEGLTELDFIAYQSELVADIQQEVYQGNLTRFQQVLHPIHQAQVISGEPRKRLKPLQWERLPKDQQRSILDVGKQLTFECLDLTKCSALTEARLQLLLSQSPDLISLTLSEFNGFSKKTLRLVSKACPSLERLVLRDLPSYTGEWSVDWIVFTAVKELQLHQAKVIQNLPVYCPSLETLILNECAELPNGYLDNNLRLSTRLQHIYINQCPNINRQSLGCFLLKGQGINANTVSLASLLIENNMLNLDGLQPTVDELRMIIRHHPVHKVTYPNAHSSIIYQIAIGILAGSLPSIPFTFVRQQYVETSIKSKGFAGHQDTITALAVLPDGRVVSGSLDTTIKVWELSYPAKKACLQTLRGHKQGVSALVVLPDGRLVSGSRDGILKIWDLSFPEEKACVLTWQGHAAAVALAVLPNAELVSGSRDGSIKVWDLTRLAQATTPIIHKISPYSCFRRAHVISEGEVDEINALVVLPDGRIVSGSSDESIKVWDFTQSGEKAILKKIEGHRGSVNALAVLPNGWLVSGSRDRTIKMWDLTRPEGEECVNTIETVQQNITGWHDIYALGVLSSNRIVSGTDDVLYAWNLAFSENIYHPESEMFPVYTKEAISALALLPDGRVVTGSASNSELKVRWFPNKNLHLDALRSFIHKFDLELNEPQIMIQVLPSEDLTGNSIELLQESLEIIFRGYQGIHVSESFYGLVFKELKEDVYSKFTNFLLHLQPRYISGLLPRGITDEELEYRLRRYPLSQNQLILSDFTRLKHFPIISMIAHSIKLDEICPSYLLWQELKVGPVQAIAVLPDGQVVCGHDRFKVLDLADIEKSKNIKAGRSHRSPINNLAVLPDGRVISTQLTTEIQVWNSKGLLENVCDQTFSAQSWDMLIALTVRSDGQVISGHNNGCLRIWELNHLDQARIHILSGGHNASITAITTLPDGRIVSASKDATLRLWYLTQLRGYSCTQILRGHKQAVSAVVALPDNRLVSGSEDRTIQVWDLTRSEAQACVQTLVGHKDCVTALAVLPNAQIVSGSDDKTLKIWDLNRHADQACVQTIQHKHKITALSVLPDGRVISGTSGDYLSVWHRVPTINLAILNILPLPLQWTVDDKKNILQYKIPSKHIGTLTLNAVFQAMVNLLRLAAFLLSGTIQSDLELGTLTVQCPNKFSLQQANAVFQAIQTRLQALATLKEQRELDSATHSSSDKPQPPALLTPAIVPNNAQLLLKHSNLWAQPSEPVVITQDDLKKSTSSEAFETLPVKQSFKKN